MYNETIQPPETNGTIFLLGAEFVRGRDVPESPIRACVLFYRQINFCLLHPHFIRSLSCSDSLASLNQSLVADQEGIQGAQISVNLSKIEKLLSI